MYRIIKQLCAERGISISTMCDECGISRSTMTELHKGRTKSLSSPIAKKVADYFCVSIDYLSGNETPTAAPDPLYSPDEAEFIASYRLASEDDKAVIDAVLRKYRQPEKKIKRA